MANWIINKLPPLHGTDIRPRVDDDIYQAPIRRAARQLRVGKVFVKTGMQGSLMYDWPAELTETDRNCWQVLTTDERELLGELLDI